MGEEMNQKLSDLEFKGNGDTFEEDMNSNGTFRKRARISSNCAAFITTIRPLAEEEQGGQAATSESRRNNGNRSTHLQALSSSQSKRDLLRVDVGSL
ncbi:hypothetical protein FRB91_008455 [Serendipita sp. 411]|nr:hypothetical protein FRC18_011288 [Serendipita sp. 400]KAG8851094.1 hypothetical protein FRB91_008455 [Serendipita sp. 411]